MSGFVKGLKYTRITKVQRILKIKLYYLLRQTSTIKLK